MLIFGDFSTCVWCRGIPDVPLIDFDRLLIEPELDLADFATHVLEAPLKFVATDRPEECARCGEKTTVLAWSRDLAASICKTCGEV